MRRLMFIFMVFGGILSANGQWQWINPLPGGASVTAMDFSDSLHGVAVGNVGTIAYTNNGGKQWFLGESSTYFDVSDVQVFKDNLAYACAGNLILKSTDGGKHWESICKDTLYFFSNFSFSSIKNGFAVVWPWNEYEFAIARTDDGGVKWKLCDQPMYASRSVAVGGFNKAIIINSGLLYKTINGGESFYTVNGDFENFAFTSVYYYREAIWYASGCRFIGSDCSSPLVFVSYDDGENWYETYESPSAPINSIDFYGNSIVMSTAKTSIIKSINAGATWKATDVPSLISSFKCISLTGENSAVLFAETLLYRTNGGNDEWEKISPFYPVDIRSACMIDSLHAFAVGEIPYLSQNIIIPAGAVFNTSDGGKNWECHFPSDYPIEDVSFCDPLNGIVLNYQSSDYLFITHNGGQSWNSLNVTIPEDPFQVQYTSPLRAYLQTMYSLFRTDDGGITWQKKSLPDCLNYTDMHFLNDSVGFLPGFQNVGIYNDGGYYKTTDGGENWQFFKHREEIPYQQQSCFPDTSTGFIIKGLNPIELWKVSMHNNVWEKIYTFEYQDDPTFKSTWFSDSLTGYVLESDLNHKSKLHITKDGGKTWDQLGVFPTVSKMVFSNADNGLLFGNQSRILRINPKLNPLAINTPKSYGKKNVDIFPNPSKDYLIISIDKALSNPNRVDVFDCNGRLIFSSYLSQDCNNYYKLNTSNLKSGFYMFLISGKNQNISGKFLVVH
jgi:photosystem II stability/assembly factor-like uncharacterized protein